MTRRAPVWWETHAEDGGDVKVGGLDSDPLAQDTACFVDNREEHHLCYGTLVELQQLPPFTKNQAD